MRRLFVVGLVALVCHAGCASPRGRGALYATGTVLTFVGTVLTARTLASDECNDPSLDLFGTAGCAGAQATVATLDMMIVALGITMIAVTALKSPSDPPPQHRVARVRRLSNN